MFSDLGIVIYFTWFKNCVTQMGSFSPFISSRHLKKTTTNKTISYGTIQGRVVLVDPVGRKVGAACI